MKKKINTIPFNRFRTPPRQNPLALLPIWLFSWLMTRSGRLKIHRLRMKGLKPPFLVLGTHHAFMDFYITPLALFPFRANYVSELEGFENYGEWLYRQAGCLGTRKFVCDVALVHNIKKVTDRGDILVLYPEARYANVGTSSALPESLGKLAKYLDVPLVTIHMRGNYLQSPIWNLHKRRGARLDTTITQQFTREEVRGASVAEINARIRQALSYDEYAWQYENRFSIRYAKRAEGLEHVLYQCPHCGTEYSMAAKNADLFCTHCGARWHMTELGRLTCMEAGNCGDTPNFIHIPDWYEWERSQVADKVADRSYSLNMAVHIESLPNAKNFIDLGTGKLIHNLHGFQLTFTEYGCAQEHTLTFAPASMFSVHTEYNYRGKGQCITLSTDDNTYFIYPLENGFNVTKIQFATECLHQYGKINQNTPLTSKS
ncbi:MAG: hypothetical protein LIO58_03580 [Oscillospiraceae bacterium]|nr:hypothetical protein [Oscillospiraceae bacterium]